MRAMTTASTARVLGWDVLRGMCAIAVALLTWQDIASVHTLGSYGVYLFFGLAWGLLPRLGLPPPERWPLGPQLGLGAGVIATAFGWHCSANATSKDRCATGAKRALARS